MNYVLMLTRNNLELTKRAVESVRAQDIPTFVCMVDNGSTDGTQEHFEPEIRYGYSANRVSATGGTMA